MKRVLLTLLLSTGFLLSGCGDTEGENLLETQKMLDNENYIGVISKLEPRADSVEDHLALGAAYMGKAGLSLVDIVNAMEEDENEAYETDDGFSSFVTKIAEQSSESALVDLGKSIDFYKKVINEKCFDRAVELSDSEKDVCLYIGLANTSKAAVTVDILADDLSGFGDESSGADGKLQASTCAMQYAFDGSRNRACSIVEKDDVTFTTIEKTYTPLEVTVDGNIYHYLMHNVATVTNKQIVLTEGFCNTTDFSTRVDTYNNGLYACPINEEKDTPELVALDVLVDVLNDGIDSIGGVDDEVRTDLNEFKCEILGGEFDAGFSDGVEDDICRSKITYKNIDLNQKIGNQAVLDYLNSQN